MLKLSFYLFLILHTFACFWFSSITYELSESMDAEKLYPDEPWYAPLFWLNFLDEDLYAPDKDLGSKYWTMLYYSILFLGCNELGPVSTMNFVFCVLILRPKRAGLVTGKEFQLAIEAGQLLAELPLPDSCTSSGRSSCSPRTPRARPRSSSRKRHQSVLTWRCCRPLPRRPRRQRCQGQS